MKINLLVLFTLYSVNLIFSQSLFPFSKNELWGYMDTTGTVIIEPQFPMAGFFSDDLAYVQIGEALGYIDKTGAVIIPAEYSSATNFIEGFASVMVDEDWMIINKQGEFTTDSYFADPMVFHNGLAKIKLERGLFSTYGMINTIGDTIIPLLYEYLSVFSDGLCMASSDRMNYGYINIKNEWVIKPEFELGGVVKINGDYNFSEKDFSNGYATFQKEGKFGVLDKTGKAVLAPTFEFLGNYSEGLIPAKKGKKYGYINTSGKWIIKPIYSGAEKFKNGLAAVSKGPLMDAKWGFVDHKGKISIPVTIYSYYNWADSMVFWEGFVPCYIVEGVFGYVNRCGKTIWRNDE